jgi:hypothetical protein
LVLWHQPGLLRHFQSDQDSSVPRAVDDDFDRFYSHIDCNIKSF